MVHRYFTPQRSEVHITVPDRAGLSCHIPIVPSFLIDMAGFFLLNLTVPLFSGHNYDSIRRYRRKLTEFKMKKIVLLTTMLLIAFSAFAAGYDFALYPPVADGDSFQLSVPGDDVITLSGSVYEFIGDYDSDFSAYSSGDGIYEITAGHKTVLVVTEDNENKLLTAIYSSYNTPSAIILSKDVNVNAEFLASCYISHVFVCDESADLTRYVRSLQSEGIRVSTYSPDDSIEYAGDTLRVRSLASSVRPHHRPSSSQELVAICPHCGEFFTLTPDNCFVF